MADCPFSKIVVMQLFYELKQKFPTIPDQVVSECIQQNSYDKEACEFRLSNEFQKYQLHSYPSGIVDKMSEGKEKCYQNYHHQQNERKHQRPKSLSIPPLSLPLSPPCDRSHTFSRRSYGRQSFDNNNNNNNRIDRRPASCGREKSIDDDRTGADVVSRRFVGSQTVDDEKLRSKCNSVNDLRKPFTNLLVRGNVRSRLYGGSVPVNLNVATELGDNNRDSIENIEISSNHSDVFISDLKLHLRNDDRGSERTSLKVKYGLKKPETLSSYSDPCTPSAGYPSHSVLLNDSNNNDNNSNINNNNDNAIINNNNNNNNVSGDSDEYNYKNNDSTAIGKMSTGDNDDISNNNCPVTVVAKTNEPKRPFTSVNLTLRPPSSEPQPAIDILADGSKLTYSMLHCDDKLGYQNEFLISISEEGKTTLSASRMKRCSDPTAGSVVYSTRLAIPDRFTSDRHSDSSSLSSAIFPTTAAATEPLSPVIFLRLTEQVKCRRKLEKELNRDKIKLETMQNEVAAMEIDLDRRRRKPFVSEKVIQLRLDVRTLELKCSELINMLDFISERKVPLGELEDDVSRNNNSVSQQRLQHSRAVPLPQLNMVGENGNWTCHMCTFRNHPMLPKCEQCEMVRVDFTNALTNFLRPTTAPSQLQTFLPRV